MSPERRRPPIPWPLGAMGEPIYAAMMRARNRAFDAGRGVTRLSVPVISVGNLSVGGTGKTPMVMTILQWLKDHGRRPCVAMRGYARAGEQASDEEAQYRAAFAGVTIVARPDRLAGLAPVLAKGEADCVVLDDGFQHRAIARALDIVLVDATRDPFGDRCLPAGWLREPVDSLARASAVVLTHAERAEASTLARLSDKVQRAHGQAPIAHAAHVWRGLRRGDEELAPSWLSSARVAAACGIGNPGPFIAALESHGADVTLRDIRPDHHAWSGADVRLLERAASQAAARAIIVTEKDWVKIRPWLAPGEQAMWVRPVLALEFPMGGEELRRAVITAASGDASDPGSPQHR